VLPPPAPLDPGSISIDISSVSGTAPVPASDLVKKPAGFPAWAAVLGVGVLLLATGAWVLLRPQPAAVVTPPVVEVAEDAGARAMVVEPPRPIAIVEPPPQPPPVDEVADAGAAVAVAPDPVKPPKPPKPVRKPVKKPLRPEPPPEKTPAVADAQTGTVEFRVRPYASVFVNGKPYGDTPIGELVLPVGKIQVKLVNKELNKDVSLPFEVKPGKNTFRHNLEE
jgi:serine/threonine-protein kinase